MNVAEYILAPARVRDKVALVTLEGEFTFQDLNHAVEAVASFLVEAGARKGDRVLLLGENSFFWVACYLGTIKAGCTTVPVPPVITPAELAWIVQSCEVRFACVHSKIGEGQGRVLSSQMTISEDARAANLNGRTVESFGKILKSPLPRVQYPAIDEKKDLAALMFTSGSTREPRGVMVSHLNIMANTTSIIEYLELSSDDRVMVVLPFYYCFGTSLLHTHLRVSGSLVLDSRFMFPDKVLTRMQETQCTGFAAVPSHYQLLLRKSSLKQMSFPYLRWVQQAGGRLADAFVQELRQSLRGTRIFIMYGQTEGTARLSYLPPELLDRKLGSIGKGIRGTRLEVLNGAGQPVAPGEVGEIVAEGENVTLGYWKAEGETRETFRGGRLYTGDLATVDQDGYIFVVDRLKDILKCGGTRISCKEVEDRLLAFEGLVEVAVIGVPDGLLGEAVKAFVVPKAKNDFRIELLESFCARSLPANLIPKEIVVLDELPKSPAGKVLKPILKRIHRGALEAVCCALLDKVDR